MARPKLEAEKRTIAGRKVKKLRREGILPTNLYGDKISSMALQLPIKEFQRVYDQVGESGLVDLKADGQVYPVLIHNVQLHPLTELPLHADFHKVSLTEKTTAMVAIEMEGESPAVEQKLGILIQPLSEVEVEALPQDLPERLTVDISKLEQVGDAVTVADIKTDPKVEIKANKEEVVAKIDELAEEEVAPAPAEGEEGVAPEGEVPAEGEAGAEGTEGGAGKAESESKAGEEKQGEGE